MTLKKRPSFSWKRLILIVFSISYLIGGTSDFRITKAQDNQEDKCTKVALAFGSTFKELYKLEKEFVACGGSTVRDFFIPQQLDKFGLIGLDGEWARLDNLAIQLQNDPESLAYIVIYGGKINKYGELKERPKPLVHYLTTKRGIDPKRIKIIEGGFREKFEFELWTSQSEKMFPPLSPTVEPEKVIFRGKMKPLPVDF
jgi:hypothetical protein